MVTLVLVVAVLAAFCLVMRSGMDEEEGMGFDPIKSHGQGLKEHGKGLQEQVAGGKKCPHCGKPI